MRTEGPGESGLLLLDAVEVLESQEARYAVVGAMAASVHGVVRASMDADAVVSVPSHSLHALELAFRRAGFATELRHGDTDDPIGAVLVLHDTHGNRLDDARHALAAGRELIDVELLRRSAAGFGADTAAAVERLLAE